MGMAAKSAAKPFYFQSMAKKKTELSACFELFELFIKIEDK